MKLKYVRLEGTRQLKHPTSNTLKPVFEGSDLDISLEDGLVTVLSTQTGRHISVPLEHVDHVVRAEWPVVGRSQPAAQPSQQQGSQRR